MGLTWSLSAAIATVALLLIGGAIVSKAKHKKDSPLYRVMERFKRKKTEDPIEDNLKYKRLSHKGGVKW